MKENIGLCWFTGHNNVPTGEHLIKVAGRHLTQCWFSNNREVRRHKRFIMEACSNPILPLGFLRYSEIPKLTLIDIEHDIYHHTFKSPYLYEDIHHIQTLYTDKNIGLDKFDIEIESPMFGGKRDWLCRTTQALFEAAIEDTNEEIEKLLD